MGSKVIKKENKVKKFTTRMQSTLLTLFCGIILLLILLIIVLVKINNEDGERYSKKVLNQQSYVSSVIPYRRGDIVDRKGTVLATSVKVYNLVLDLKKLMQYDEYLDKTLDAISKHFEIDRQELEEYKKTKAESSYLVLKKEIDEETVLAFESMMEKEDNKIKGVWFEEEYKRTYPYDSLASAVLGFTVSGDVGTNGIEEYYNSQLVGENGISFGYFDSDLKLQRSYKDVKDGNTIVTTLDASVQEVVEKKIDELMKQYPSKSVSVLVMNPNNGDIYAMSTDRHYNLNDPRDLTKFYSKEEIDAMDMEAKMNALFEIWRNNIVSDIFEPGSTFKPFTVAAALEENKVDYDKKFNCDGGETYFGKRLRCSKRQGHGVISLAQGLASSCNDVMMQLAQKMGSKIFAKYQSEFMFGKKTNIDLPGEEPGLVFSEDRLGVTELASSSFGQGVSVNMLQIAAAYASLVNGGYYYEPHIMKQIKNSSGAVIDRNDGVLVKQTVSEETSKFIREASLLAVTNGTAGGAHVDNYTVGGKTGTAQKQPYSSGKYILSFIGGVPMEHPEVIIYVTLNEIEDETVAKDSKIATIFASDILKNILPYLGIYPDGEIDYSVFGVNVNDESADDKKNEESVESESSDQNVSEETIDSKEDKQEIEDNNSDKTQENSNENQKKETGSDDLSSENGENIEELEEDDPNAFSEAVEIGEQLESETKQNIPANKKDTQDFLKNENLEDEVDIENETGEE